MFPRGSILPVITLIGCGATDAPSRDTTVEAEPRAMSIAYEGGISALFPAASDEAPALVISLLDADDAADGVACQLLFELDDDVAMGVQSGIPTWSLWWGFRLEQRFAGARGPCGGLDVTAWAGDLAADLDDFTIGFTHEAGDSLVTWAELGDGLVPTGQASAYATQPDGLLASDPAGEPVALSLEDTVVIPDGYYLSVPTVTFPLTSDRSDDVDVSDGVRIRPLNEPPGLSR